MTTNHRAELSSINSFPSLVKYLRDELGWPIAGDDFEDLTFDYTPEELGIDHVVAAKIQEIKRLRPLTPNQPWGIFFVKFEPKKLPVVALRRILSRVVVKKRASANSADRVAWAADDLLFISNFGAGDHRQISVAHFSQDAGNADLPVLKVLGWDNLDSPLHLDHVAELLAEHLSWPEDEQDPDQWRQQWRSAFTLEHLEVITTSKRLAERLASLARAIRDRIETALDIESEHGPLTKLLEAFRGALIHDLDRNGFADMYAQTIAYGLLSARIANPHSDTVDDFTTHMRTSPFLRDLMETFLGAGRRDEGNDRVAIDFDELGVSDVIELLDGANIEAVARDFGDRNPQQDPVIHFYELFLTAYDPQRRMQRGVFYTPRPVVSYIVRSVHELLRTEFGLADGLADLASWRDVAQRDTGVTIPEGVDPADRFVTILDPATGTGTFLVEVIEVIHQTLVDRWKREGLDEGEILARWNEFVPAHLLPRLHGYELLMAPYAIAHLKLGLKLYETGYRFESQTRARIYLTNSLEPRQDFSGRFDFEIPALAQEAQAVNEIKSSQRFTVVLGNPPYSGHSVNNDIAWIVDKVYDYKRGVEGLDRPAQAKWLQDDYVKFIRFAEARLADSGAGVLGFITNHGYLDNPTFRGMRGHLMRTFSQIAVVDLHGNRQKARLGPDGRPDKNVFDIEQGVAMAIATAAGDAGPRVRHADVWGERTTKYEWLFDHSYSTTGWADLSPAEPLNLFIPQDTRFLAEYEEGWRISDIFSLNGDPAPAMVTTHDQFAISWSADEAAAKVDELLATRTETEARERWRLCSTSQWSYDAAKRELSGGEWRDEIALVAYRPFDTRWTVMNPRVAVHQRLRVMRHLIDEGNVALVVPRRIGGGPWEHTFVSDSVTDDSLVSNRSSERGFVFPLWLKPEKDGLLDGEGDPEPNLSRGFLTHVSEQTQLTYSVRKANDVMTFGPADVFGYIYGLLHAPSYRARFAEYFRSDFPRIPVTRERERFRALADIGLKLRDLHLLRPGSVDTPAGFPVAGSDIVGAGFPKWVAAGETDPLSGGTCEEGRIYINDGPGSPQYFGGIAKATWEFKVGAYQVCSKWLKDRRGRALLPAEADRFGRVAAAVQSTTELMLAADEAAGDWPLV